MVAQAAWLDYVVFILIMLASLLTGVYFSFGQKNTETYLYGNRQMPLLPVSTSLVVSFISAISMQGTPAEVYIYGVQFLLMETSVFGFWVAALTFVPLYYPLKLTSVYQYLDMRFESRAVVVFAYAMGLFTANLYMGIIIYAPAVALESIIHTPTWINIIAISLTSTIYTAIGGMKAVVWNDTFQAVVMVVGLVVVIVTGTLKVGGFHEVWYQLHRRGRTQFDYSPDPTIRISFWYGLLAILPGAGILGTQPALMRYNAVSSEQKARLLLYIGSLGKFLISTLAALSGAVVLAYYSKIGCEPMATGAINNPNQILPYFLVDALDMPGIPGLFFAAIVAASLSTLSSVQNAMAAVVWKEIISPCVGAVSDARETLFLKLMVVVFGVVSTVIAFGAKFIGGTLIQIAILVLSVTDVPAISLFFIGAFFTFTSGGAAVLACIGTIAFYLVIELGRHFTKVDWPQPPLINETCFLDVIHDRIAAYNGSISDIPHHEWINHFWKDVFDFSYSNHTLIVPETAAAWSIFRLSPYMYGSVGVLLALVLSVTLSLTPCLRHKKPVSSSLLFPIARKFRGVPQEEILMDDLVVNTVAYVNPQADSIRQGESEASGLRCAESDTDFTFDDGNTQLLDTPV